MSHTPGPWEIGDGRGTGLIVPSGVRPFPLYGACITSPRPELEWENATGKHRWPVVVGGQDDWGPTGVITEDDARLIAAAPELLAALQEIVAWAVVPGEQFSQARAAIAKATGEAS